MKKVLLLLAVVMMMAGASFATVTPIQLSLWDRIALPPCDEVYGLEIGIGSKLDTLKGVQFNLVKSEVENGWGVQSAIFSRIHGHFTGLQTGFVTLSGNGTLVGVNYGFFNKIGNVKGLQLGFINFADEATGLQFGFFNKANQGNGFLLQIGLLNALGNSSFCKWFPFINLKV